MRKSGFAVCVLFALPAFAGTIDTPQCRADLPRASRMISDVAARDNAGPIRDPARLCATLRLNRRDMAAAADILDRCLTGHERNENVAHLRVSVAEVDGVIARRCR